MIRIRPLYLILLICGLLLIVGAGVWWTNDISKRYYSEQLESSKTEIQRLKNEIASLRKQSENLDGQVNNLDEQLNGKKQLPFNVKDSTSIESRISVIEDKLGISHSPEIKLRRVSP
jgi:septal ring factor EnvC (AmiA/AmiB activator)